MVPLASFGATYSLHWYCVGFFVNGTLMMQTMALTGINRVEGSFPFITLAFDLMPPSAQDCGCEVSFTVWDLRWSINNENRDANRHMGVYH